MPVKAAPLTERFLRYVSPEPNSGCWLWTGSVQHFGYGRLYVGNGPQLAHRLSWMIHNGPIPAELFVLHKCDVPACVNPDHLFLGTHDINMLDCQRKGRRPRGEGHNFAKLQVADVRIIKRLLWERKTQAAVAKRFGVSVGAVAAIAQGRSWKGVNAESGAATPLRNVVAQKDHVLHDHEHRPWGRRNAGPGLPKSGKVKDVGLRD